MTNTTRRTFLATAALAPLGARVLSAAPPAEAVTPALVEAARKEGKITYYTAMEINVAEAVGKAFEAKYPGVKVRVERTGSERLFQRIGQEVASRINVVDVASSADAAHFLAWKREGLLTPYVSEEMAKHFAADQRDADGFYFNQRTHLSTIAYNTKLVAPADAPKGFRDLLDPKWAGKMVKGHPGYSGTIMTATQQLARDLGWDYFEKLSKQRVMQVQSATEPPKKIELGERAIAVDGSDYLFWLSKERGAPVEIVHAVEGTPLITNPQGVFKTAPNPNAARLFASWLLSGEGQQFIVDISGQYPAHGGVKSRANRPALSAIKTLKEDPAAVEREADEIKTRYARYFKV